MQINRLLFCFGITIFFALASEVALLLWRNGIKFYIFEISTKSLSLQENVIIHSNIEAISIDKVKQWENSIREHYSKDIRTTRVSICRTF